MEPTPLIQELRRQRQANLCEFEASLVYRVSSRTARAVTQRNPVSKNQSPSTIKKVWKDSPQRFTVIIWSIDIVCIHLFNMHVCVCVVMHVNVCVTVSVTCRK